MKKIVFLIAFVLLVLHQDFWNWDNGGLVFGFMPVGLAYHAGFSLACAVLAVLAIKFAWPKDLVTWADKDEEGDA